MVLTSLVNIAIHCLDIMMLFLLIIIYTGKTIRAIKKIASLSRMYLNIKYDKYERREEGVGTKTDRTIEK